jgi:RNA polymerase sigma factor (sigma-70 family)
MPNDDLALVREFAATGSEVAFQALVARHLDAVYSAALRRVGGDDALAQDIAQAVFIILARKAGALGPETILAGWLQRTTRHAAADALKRQRRQQLRDHQAYMEANLNPPDPAPSDPAASAVWQQISPHLEAALDRLGETDHNAVVLRFFEDKTFPEIAAALGTSEAAAKMRVARSLEKLKKILSQDGVALSATVLAGAVTANAVHAAPSALAAKVSVLAAKGAATTTSITTLVKGVLKTMAWAKAKLAFTVGAFILAASIAPFVFALTHAHPNRSQVEYQVEGNLVFQTYGPDGKVVAEILRDFAVLVDGSQWLITTTNKNSRGEILTSWATGSTNNAEIFSAVYYIKGFTTALVESNSMPSGCEDGVSQYLWLMLASGHYLDGMKSNELPPVYDVLFSVLYDKDLKYPAFVERSTNSPNLPSRIVYMNDGFNRTRDSKNQKTLLFKNAPPFDKGYTNAVFAIVGVTNFENMDFPTGFNFVEYAPALFPPVKPDPSLPAGAPIVFTSNRVLGMKRKMEATINHIGLTKTTKSLLPMLPANTVVQDRRLMNVATSVKPITYSAQKGNWKSVEDVKLMAGKKPADQKQPVAKRFHGSYLKYYLSAALLLILVPAIYLFRKTRNI